MRPKADTRAWLDRKPGEVVAMFDAVARRYDVVNDLLSLGQDRLWRREVVAAIDPKPGQRILDLAAGTGTSSAPLAQAGALVVATDLSFDMAAFGKRRQPGLTFVNGDALHLPFANSSFDAVTVSFGLRNIHDIHTSLSELLRVTKPGGRIVICEFSTPTSPMFRRLYHDYLGAAMPRIAGWTSSDPAAYHYLSQSILAWPTQQALADLMHDIGWRHVEWKNLTGGIVALHRATVPPGS